MTDKILEQLNELKETIEMTVGQFSLSYRMEYEQEDQDAMYATLIVEWREKDYAKVTFLVKENSIRINKYEDVYEDLTIEHIWETLFFSTL